MSSWSRQQHHIFLLYFVPDRMIVLSPQHVLPNAHIYILCHMNKMVNGSKYGIMHVHCAFLMKFSKFYERKHSLKILCYWPSSWTVFYSVCFHCYVLHFIIIIIMNLCFSAVRAKRERERLVSYALVYSHIWNVKSYQLKIINHIIWKKGKIKPAKKKNVEKIKKN